MRLTRISLTNFRSFRDTQTIELAPVTLLFGPNSVGKSSVLMALYYLKQILETGDCNPQRLTSLNNKYVGGFENLVYGRNLDNKIVIRVEFNKFNSVGSSYGFVSELLESIELFDQIDVGISSPSVAANIMAVEVEVSWSKSIRNAYVSRYKVSYDGIDICEVTSDSGVMQPMLVGVNYFHPLLLPEDLDADLLAKFDETDPIHSDFFDRVCELKGLYSPSHQEVCDGAEVPFNDDAEDTPTFDSFVYVSEFHEVLNEERNLHDSPVVQVNYTFFADHEVIHVPIGIGGLNGALPNPGKKISTTLDLENRNQIELMVEILSDLLVSPLDNLIDIFESSLCIGPIREIPEYIAEKTDSLKMNDWYSGLSAWETVKQLDIGTLRSIDEWISGKNRLDLGVGIALSVGKGHREYKRASSNVSFKQMSEQLDRLLHQYYSPQSDLLSKVDIDETSEFKSYTLWDLDKNIAVSPNDLGVGISQLFPLVVAACCRKSGFIACEQPELHVHPRIQVAIGDLLIQANRSVGFIIESHSEHLLLRLLKRIRQTSDKELPDGYMPVSEDDVSIVYLDPTASGAVAKRIRIDQDGEFVDRWPSGFFTERREELM